VSSDEKHGLVARATKDFTGSENFMGSEADDMIFISIPRRAKMVFPIVANASKAIAKIISATKHPDADARRRRLRGASNRSILKLVRL
jgi:hypothetical protein